MPDPCAGLGNFPEFSRYVLEMLRQPLEGGEVTISRVHGSIRFPARFMLVAMIPVSRRNPCGTR